MEYTAALKNFAKNVSTFLSETEPAFDNTTMEEFVASYVKPGKFYPLFGYYTELLNAFGTSVGQEFESRLKEEFACNARNEEFMGAAEEYNQAEANYLKFVGKLDSKFGSLKSGNVQDLRLECLETEEKENLVAAGCQVALVSFSPKDALKEFKKRAAGEFDCFWDPTCLVYNQFGMGHSLSKIFGLKTIYWFVENIPTGKVHMEREGHVPDDDVLMLGGDIIFNNATGEIVYRFPQESAIARPDIKSVLNILKENA